MQPLRLRCVRLGKPCKHCQETRAAKQALQAASRPAGSHLADSCRIASSATALPVTAAAVSTLCPTAVPSKSLEKLHRPRSYRGAGNFSSEVEVAVTRPAERDSVLQQRSARGTQRKDVRVREKRGEWRQQVLADFEEAGHSGCLILQQPRIATEIRDLKEVSAVVSIAICKVCSDTRLYKVQNAYCKTNAYSKLEIVF